MTEQPPELRPHGDPMRPYLTTDPDGQQPPEPSPSDLPAPEPIDGPDSGGDEDPGAGAD